MGPKSLLHAFASLLLLDGRADVLSLTSLSVLPDLVLAAIVSATVMLEFADDACAEQWWSLKLEPRGLEEKPSPRSGYSPRSPLQLTSCPASLLLTR